MKIAAAIWSTWTLLVLSFIAVGPMLGFKAPEIAPVAGLSTALVLTIAGALGLDTKALLSRLPSFIGHLAAYAPKSSDRRKKKAEHSERSADV